MGGGKRSLAWVVMKIAAVFHLRPSEVEAMPPGELAMHAAFVRLEGDPER